MEIDRLERLAERYASEGENERSWLKLVKVGTCFLCVRELVF